MMEPMTLNQIANAIPGELRGPDAIFNHVSTDTRQLNAGDLYVALCGQRFDGHEFVEQAFSQGACAAVIQREVKTAGTTLQVMDTLRALGGIAACNRELFTGPLVGITGSSGKTTTKNLLAAILQTRGSTLATHGNLNNEIGVPLTLLQLAPAHQFAVIEMGASRKGDIDYLCGLARPDVSILLNVMPAHLEGFGSIDGVAAAKSEIFSGLMGRGTAVFDAGSHYVELFRSAAGSAQVMTFSMSSHADVYCGGVTPNSGTGVEFELVSPLGSASVCLQLLGRHNIINALAAAAAAIAAGCTLDDLVQGLQSAQAEPGRMCAHAIPEGRVIIDDSYNANPASVHAAIDVLAEYPGKRVLALGAMAELGADSGQLHRTVGQYAFERGIDELWCVGPGSFLAATGFGDGARCFDRLAELIEEADRLMSTTDILLVKGSRSAGMDQLVAHVLAETGVGS